MILCPSVTKANNHIGDPRKNNNYEEEKQKYNKINCIKRHVMYIFIKLFQIYIIWKNQECL